VYSGSSLLSDPFNGPTTDYKGISISSGVYSAWFSAGLMTTSQLLSLALGCVSLAFVFVIAGIWHNHRVALTGTLFSYSGSILKHHLAIVLGLGSISWSGHLVHAPLEGITYSSTRLLAGLNHNRQSLLSVWDTNWDQHSDLLTLSGVIDPVTSSIPLSDVIHHHLAVGCILIVTSHLYRSVIPLGSSPDLLLRSHGSLFVSSWHSQLAVNLGAVGTASILAAHLIPAGHVYPYLAIDSGACLSLFTHHAWIGGIFILGSGAHASIYLLSDYRLGSVGPIDRVLRQRHTIIAHLNWACLFLGFHSFGLYIHNDTLAALGRPFDLFSDSGIALVPWVAVLAQSIGIPGLTISGVGTFANLGVSDFMVHHVHAFTIHVTALILLKGFLFSRSSGLVADKHVLGFRFPCDGPGRGGTCQISSWDHIYLASFWMYNSISVVIFHYSWKLQSTVLLVSKGEYATTGSFEESGILINGWLRDFLWSQASQVIQSYGSSAGPYGLFFLAAHFTGHLALCSYFRAEVTGKN
jgi:photosystem I P700 chlorophyll a apoprotein A1